MTADGAFGSLTFAALRAWQTRARVPITGVLDKATWARLVPGKAPVKPAPAPKPAPVRKPVAKPPTTRYTAYKRVVLRQGSRGTAVVVLQRALKAKADGAFGPKTRSALVTFQKQQRISPNGIAGRLVWDRLEKRDYPLLAYRRLTLKLGSKGVAVVALQRALRVKADGAFGPITRAAVRAVQYRAKLSRTGVVSGATWVAIERQIRR